MSPRVNPSVPFRGGPVDINTTGTTSGERVVSYGNSSTRFGIAALSPQSGATHGDDPALGGWSQTLTSPTPGIPGDSGSAYLDRDGRALGTLSTLGLSIAVTNNIGDLNRELAYAREQSEIPGMRLVLGTESFEPVRRTAYSNSDQDSAGNRANEEMTEHDFPSRQDPAHLTPAQLIPGGRVPTSGIVAASTGSKEEGRRWHIPRHDSSSSGLGNWSRYGPRWAMAPKQSLRPRPAGLPHLHRRRAHARHLDGPRPS
jgi:hypothetical protein